MQNKEKEVSDNMQHVGLVQPTCELRINLYKNRRIEQKWINLITDEYVWKPLPLFNGTETIKST